MSKIEEVPISDVEEDESTYEGGSNEVYLALIDAAVKETDELGVEDTFIGGTPLWLHPESIPANDLLICGACKKNDNMKLLIQAFCPLDIDQVDEIQQSMGVNDMRNVDSENDRVLYVFLCTKCQRKGNSVRCIRGVKKNSKSSISTSDVVTNKINSLDEGKKFDINPFDLSNGSQNPFDGPNPFQSSSSTDNNPFENANATEKDTKKESMKTSRKVHDSQKDKEFDSKVAFKSYLLFVEPESFKNKQPDHLKLPKNLKIDKDALELGNDIEEDLEKNPIKLDPRTEKLSKFLDDDVFQKFQEIVGYNPFQVLRYDFGGKPLLYASSKVDYDKAVPSPSYNPSSKRVFEMQLMPKMILDLEETVSLEDSMEWGTILVYTDIGNCIPKFDENGVGYVEEVVKVQWETRSK
ncbi:hypothetical protein Kpol_1024p14 [Vanderwaltozyma polyspora DSM 70294]|uniref:Programmed cell death protein 2 C-terminal domain-containing protein n=1 Tax=Vanderwaltozyma polyspora (strain ATCC 22028 / DSM 70294 / BCRC 21397 / CBS 2163 / NBRC 10782 / NRRL Y-8283 / UCD 57-17) TaxID=436907 RepID=A7TLH5_VANPO|nr:uncharacterized protein Kpol_1024p14 [Vanderwaltozyma polyspora DSM 70294]EDO16861.1 hypothetical protein Kpol_1024p14 [Vanderwaltozyma polyspora DSM 70294]